MGVHSSAATGRHAQLATFAAAASVMSALLLAPGAPSHAADAPAGQRATITRIAIGQTATAWTPSANARVKTIRAETPPQAVQVKPRRSAGRKNIAMSSMVGRPVLDQVGTTVTTSARLRTSQPGRRLRLRVMEINGGQVVSTRSVSVRPSSTGWRSLRVTLDTTRPGSRVQVSAYGKRMRGWHFVRMDSLSVLAAVGSNAPAGPQTPDPITPPPAPAVPDPVPPVPNPDPAPQTPDPVLPDPTPVVPDPMVPDPAPPAPDPVVPDPAPPVPDPVVPDPTPPVPDPVVPDPTPPVPDPVVPDPTPPASGEPAPAASCEDIDYSDPAQGVQTFSDEFNGAAIDRAKWRVRDNTFLNHDAAWITKDAVKVHDGYLDITGQRLSDSQFKTNANASYPGENTIRKYSTGYLDTIDAAGYGNAAANRFGQKYGHFEMRAWVPTASTQSKGLWPAFWLRADHERGEIDAMESYGAPTIRGTDPSSSYEWNSWEDTSRVLSSDHTHGRANVGSDQIWQGWHTYAVNWSPHCMRYLYDGRTVGLVDFDAAGTQDYFRGVTFNDSFHLRLNMQIGSKYWGWPNSTDTRPESHFKIDWVRVHQGKDVLAGG
ncbi:MAG: hypothetical protein JWP31_875 [Aeromicrobium sp.]|nr:hypothetical protein [Aeromicrobium sp.]